MLMLVVGFVIAAVLLTAEYLLCTKLENPLWGGMIPLFLLAGTVWLFASEIGRASCRERVSVQV